MEGNTQPNFEDLVLEIKARVFDGRGFVKDKAEEVAELLADFGVYVGSVAMKTSAIKSGQVKTVKGEVRIYSGNRSVTGRGKRWTWYIYDYVAIPADVDVAKALAKLRGSD